MEDSQVLKVIFGILVGAFVIAPIILILAKVFGFWVTFISFIIIITVFNIGGEGQ